MTAIPNMSTPDQVTDGVAALFGPARTQLAEFANQVEQAFANLARFIAEIQQENQTVNAELRRLAARPSDD
jgi:hypothetical protein